VTQLARKKVFYLKTDKRLLACFLTVGLLQSPLALAEGVSYRIMPYLWTAGMDVEIGPPGMTTDAKVSFSDYAEFVDIGAAMAFEARGERWSVGGNFLWAELSEDIGLPTTTLGIEVEQFLLELFVGFQPSGWEDVRIIAGARYLDIKTKIDFVNLSDVRIGDDFADPYVGFIWQPRRGKWEYVLEADAGGGIDSDFAWSFTAGFGYHFSERMAWTAGYRLIDIDYAGDDFVFDGTLDGLQIGLMFKF